MAIGAYRLALDLGSTSLGWAVLRLNGEDLKEPTAIVRAGVRIFSDGRNPKDGSSLAVTRRDARGMRRRRDRLLKRKARLMNLLVHHGFFPADLSERKKLETLDPYELRAKGLDHALTPAEFARALFHMNQRRGFQSNRRTDKKENDSGALKAAIRRVRESIHPQGQNGLPRTVGEWLHQRAKAREPVRARFRQQRVTPTEGKARIDKSYDLYVERAMVGAEFDSLWAKQSSLNPTTFNETARVDLKDCLLHQRPLRPVRPGRCTLLPHEQRTPLALPSQQKFRILQEVNNLRWLDSHLHGHALMLEQRDAVVQAMEQGNASFKAGIARLAGLPGSTKFNLADEKRVELKGNTTSIRLAKNDLFGPKWHGWTLEQQDAIVRQLLSQQSLSRLVHRLIKYCGISEAQAERIAEVELQPGCGSLCRKAIYRILPELNREVVSFAEAAKRAGFHHSRLNDHTEVAGRTFAVEHVVRGTGEIKTFHAFRELPYYGEFLQRHVGFADPQAKDTDPPEKRFGRIANPTVHIGLNQVRAVVNALIRQYGHPSEVVVEVARDLKQNREQREESTRRQAANQRRNERLRETAAGVLQCAPERVKHADIQKLILWEELSPDAAARHCPYSGVQIGMAMLLSPEVEIEHILPFSQTLDDSLNNKTVAMRRANRIKGNRTPWEARDDFARQGWDYAGIVARAGLMDKRKRYRFAEDGYQQWLREDKDFLARALNDTRYLSRVAREYMSLVCPQATWVIPGQMTAMLRGQFGLNNILGLNGEKNREDHRHHAVDACVIGITDRGLLKRFANTNADARKQDVHRLVEGMQPPWPTYRAHVERAMRAIHVSHKPDHGHEGAMHNDTAYALLGDGKVGVHKQVDGKRVWEESALKVIEFTAESATERHGLLPDGTPRPYKGYKGDSNYCIEIFRAESGKWEGDVISTFDAYQIFRQRGVAGLRHPNLSRHGKPLVMRLMIGDSVRLVIDGQLRTMRVASMNAAGRLTLADLNEANTDARNRDQQGDWRYTYKQAGSLQKAQGRQVSVSPAGLINDSGFRA